jgi:hypothetical protein
MGACHPCRDQAPPAASWRPDDDDDPVIHQSNRKVSLLVTGIRAARGRDAEPYAHGVAKIDAVLDEVDVPLPLIPFNLLGVKLHHVLIALCHARRMPV